MTGEPSTIPKPHATILILVEGGEPEGHEGGAVGWAGYLRYWGKAVERLAVLGYNPIVGTLRAPGPLQEFATSRGWSTFDLGAGSATSYPAAAVRLRHLIRSAHVDLVHANESIQGLVGGVGARLAGVPIVFHRHHTSADQPLRAFTRIASKLADVTMAVSEAVRSAAASEGVSVDKIVVAQNGSAAFPREEDGSSVRDTIGAPPDLPLVAVVGHLRPEKGHLALIGAVAQVARETDQEIGLLIVGQGPERAQLEDAGKAAPGVRPFFVGHQADVHRYFLASDVVAVPSYRESFGLAALEAMSCGRPVVASDVEGLRELIEHDKSGLLVPPGDEQGLSLAIRRCLTDPELASRLGQNGRVRYASSFTLEAMVDRWADTYERVLGHG